MRETRRKALAIPSAMSSSARYYLDRNKFDDTESEAWAIGGSAGFKTGYFRERFALGATGYTSQRLLGDDDKDGTLLLEPGPGRLHGARRTYGEFLFNEDTPPELRTPRLRYAVHQSQRQSA